MSAYVKKIVKEYLEGATLKELGDKYYTSGSQIRNLLIKEKVYIFNRRIEIILTKEKLLKHLEKMTKKQIAKKYKISRKTVSRLKKKYMEEIQNGN